MYRFALLVIFVTLLTSSISQAASYRMRSDTIVDPILDTSGNTHPYRGHDLGNHAFLAHPDLTDANLTEADLYRANLTGPNLTNAILIGADLYDADLANARDVSESIGSPAVPRTTLFRVW